MYDHYQEFVAPKGKFRVIGIDEKSIPKRHFIVSDYDSLGAARKERITLQQVERQSVPTKDVRMWYCVFDEHGMEQRFGNPEISWTHDFFCGIHSGMLLCCVLWYCDVWYPSLSKQLHLTSDTLPVGYVMCPDCLTKYVEQRTRPIQVKICSCCEQIMPVGYGQKELEIIDSGGKKY